MSFIEGFFDDENAHRYKLWSKKHEDSLLAEPILSHAYFGKRSKSEKDLTKRCFILTPNHLYYKKSPDDPKIRGVMNLKWTRTEFDCDDEIEEKGEYNFSIKFIKNLKFTEIFTQSKKVYFEWKNLLGQLTIQTNFHLKFNVIKMIGKGSFARVYLIEHNETKAKYAVKAFSKEYLKSQKNGRESLINEIDVMLECKHENCIDLVELHETMNSLYLVMELMEGGEIFSLSKGKLDNESTFSVMKGIMKALVYLEKNGIMHRDLKPDNIIFKHKDLPATENVLKLVDFGLATHQDVKEYLFKRCGTPGFVAPEVINAKSGSNVHYSTKCDVFSVGIIFYFMLTGKIPYDGKDFDEVLENNKKATIDFSIKELKAASTVAVDLLKRMLELEPANRLSAADVMKHEYFAGKEPTTMIFDEDPEMNLAHNLEQFQKKYKDIKVCPTDSIRFNLNPDINGNLNTFMSEDKGGSNRIDSFSSDKKKIINKNLDKVKNAANQKRTSIYKYALTKGEGKVDLHKELEKLANMSMDSYDSKDSEASSSEDGSQHSGKSGKSGSQRAGKNEKVPNKSRFANR